MRRNPDDPCRCPDACAYYCPIHATHHVVPGMVDFCVDKATMPLDVRASA